MTDAFPEVPRSEFSKPKPTGPNLPHRPCLCIRCCWHGAVLICLRAVHSHFHTAMAELSE